MKQNYELIYFPYFTPCAYGITSYKLSHQIKYATDPAARKHVYVKSAQTEPVPEKAKCKKYPGLQTARGKLKGRSEKKLAAQLHGYCANGVVSLFSQMFLHDAIHLLIRKTRALFATNK